MAEADQTFRDSLAALLRYPEVKEHFRRMEGRLVDRLAEETNQENIIELVRMLKVIRSFAKGTATVQQMKDLKESGYKPRIPDDDDNKASPPLGNGPQSGGRRQGNRRVGMGEWRRKPPRMIIARLSCGRRVQHHRGVLIGLCICKSFGGQINGLDIILDGNPETTPTFGIRDALPSKTVLAVMRPFRTYQHRRGCKYRLGRMCARWDPPSA